MRITPFLQDNQILAELGQRLKTARIRAHLTQAQFAKNSGVAKSTIERAEKGESIQVANLIKLMRTLAMLPSLEMLLPTTEPTPMEYLAIKDSSGERKRVYAKRNKDATYNIRHTNRFKWGDEE